MNKLAVGITLVLVALAIFLIWKENESWATKVINFIGIFSSLLGLFSIYVNLNILQRVESIEHRREKVAKKLKEELYFRYEITKVEAAITSLIQIKNKESLEKDETLANIRIIKRFVTKNKDRLQFSDAFDNRIGFIENKINLLNVSGELDVDLLIFLSDMNTQFGEVISKIEDFKTRLLSEDIIE